jgi:hypothetical protein
MVPTRADETDDVLEGGVLCLSGSCRVNCALNASAAAVALCTPAHTHTLRTTTDNSVIHQQNHEKQRKKPKQTQNKLTTQRQKSKRTAFISAMVAADIELDDVVERAGAAATDVDEKRSGGAHADKGNWATDDDVGFVRDGSRVPAGGEESSEFDGAGERGCGESSGCGTSCEGSGCEGSGGEGRDCASDREEEEDVSGETARGSKGTATTDTCGQGSKGTATTDTCVPAADAEGMESETVRGADSGTEGAFEGRRTMGAKTLRA